MNVDIYTKYIVSHINRINNNFKEIISFFEDDEMHLEIKKELDFIKYYQKNLQVILKNINEESTDYFEIDNEKVLKLQSFSDRYIGKILPKLRSSVDELKSDSKNTTNSLFNFPFRFLRGLRSPMSILDRTPDLLKELNDLIREPQSSYLNILSEYITNELKENFQVSEIQHLINYSSDNSLFIIENFIKININREKGLSVQILLDFPTFFERINHILFFESPVYWRMLHVIDDLSDYEYKNNDKGYEVLTGIPKHFYDLRELLFTNFKEGERPNFIRNCADDLKTYLKGSFKSSDSDLTFENANGQSIPKNLVSFGMTNIGIIQAVLSKNIINKGSFIFIDEPESNLHPEWQSVLSEVLVKLASNQVNIIITTHSSDMLKALEVNAEKTDTVEIDSLISTHYFKGDGKLLDLEGISSFEKIASARAELLKPYNALSIKKSLFND